MECNDNRASATLAPPLAEQFARRLLRAAATNALSPDDLTVLAATTYARLRIRLAVFLGDQGFAALWWRAIQLTRRAFPTWDDATGNARSPDNLPPGFHGAVSGGDAAETHAHLLAVFTNFLALLFTFIGEDLGTRLIAQDWPDLLPDAADPQTEGVLL